MPAKPSKKKSPGIRGKPMKSGKRSPTAHRTLEQARAHTRDYASTPEQRDKRAQRNAARAKLTAEGKVKKGDGKDVHHRTSIKDGGSNSRGNLAVASRKKNRGHARRS